MFALGVMFASGVYPLTYIERVQRKNWQRRIKKCIKFHTEERQRKDTGTRSQYRYKISLEVRFNLKTGNDTRFDFTN